MQAFTTYAQAHLAMLPEAEAALKELGPRSIPLLDSWLREPPNGLRSKIRAWASTHPRFNRLLNNGWVHIDHPAIAYKAAQFIPQFGDPLLPALELRSRQSPEAIRTLIRIIDHLSPERRSQLLKENQELNAFDFE